MPRLLSRLLRRTADEVAIRTGWAQRHFASQHGKIRVLTYHSVVPDELADQPWVPSHFVTASRFERQMAALAQFGPVRTLGEALQRIHKGDAAGRPMVCVTFDDGTADNVHLALPILNKYGHQATFFLATGHIDRRGILPNDAIRLLADAYRRGRLNGDVGPLGRRLLTEPGFYKQLSLFTYRQELDDLWRHCTQAIDPQALRALRTLTWSDVRTLRQTGMEIGAHTVNHVILTREDRPSRWCEIADSIEHVREETAQQYVPFAYPNGQAGDYDSLDTDVLASLGVPFAVTQRPGWNDRTTPLFELRRNCIGLHCDDQAFLAEVFGLHDAQRQDPLRQSA